MYLVIPADSGYCIPVLWHTATGVNSGISEFTGRAALIELSPGMGFVSLALFASGADDIMVGFLLGLGPAA